MGNNRVEKQINNFINDNIDKLKQVFPNCVKDGCVDFACLKEELGEFELVEKEKYELLWAGKQTAKKVAQEDIEGYTLKFSKEESVNPERTENLYIEGENLKVLKLLRQNYFNTVKMIYIDPPYNTGNDFIYNDNFALSQRVIDEYEGNVDENGNRYIVNQKSSNRFHARWLNEMYPLIKIAKDFLKDNGSIFISIDDNEVTNLRQICDEIFGEDNFVACVIWNRKRGRDNSARWFSKSHEYLLVYAKNKNDFETNFLELDEETKKAYKNPDNDPRGDYRMLATWARGTQGGVEYDFTNKQGQYFAKRSWLFSKDNMEKMDQEDKLIIRGDNIYRKLFIHENKGKIPETIWSHTSNAANASDEIKKLFGKIVFDTPKPTPYIQEMIKIATQPGDIIMDFFSGSAATANAVMQQNLLDGGDRHFIMVQIPATCEEDSIAYKCGYKNICEIGRDRIIKEGAYITEQVGDKVDVGFKTFKLDKSNIKWNTVNMENGQVDFENATYNNDLLDFMPNTNDIDIVYEIILRQRDVILSKDTKLLSEIGKRTYLYADSYLICLEQKVSVELIEKISQIYPLPIKIVFRDSAFGDDIILKDETMRRLQALVEKNFSVKRTYTVEFI